MGKIKKGIVTIILMASLLIVGTGTSFAANVNDVDSHWASSQIKRLVDKNVIKGYADGSFRPNNNITRAEFVALINKAYNYQNTNEISYTDVSKNDWYYEEIKKAKAKGYISGYSDNTIKPNKNITRQEVATIIAKVSNDQSPFATPVSFTDSHKIASWAKTAVTYLVSAGYMNGYPDGSFGPEKFITRGEAAAILDKIFNKVEPILPKIITAPGDVKDKTELINACDNSKVEKIEVLRDIDLGGKTLKINRFVNIDLNGYTIKGDITVDTRADGKMTIEDGMLTGSLILDMGNGDFTNKANIKGTTTIKDIKNSTFINEGTLSSVEIEDNNGASFINNRNMDKLILNTDGKVKIDGEIPQLVVNKAAKITLENKVTKIVIAKDAYNFEIKLDSNKAEVKNVENNTDRKITIGNKDYDKYGEVRGTDASFRSFRVGDTDINASDAISSNGQIIKKNSIIGIRFATNDSKARYTLKVNNTSLSESDFSRKQLRPEDRIVVTITSDDGKIERTYTVNIKAEDVPVPAPVTPLTTPPVTQPSTQTTPASTTPSTQTTPASTTPSTPAQTQTPATPQSTTPAGTQPAPQPTTGTPAPQASQQPSQQTPATSTQSGTPSPTQSTTESAAPTQSAAPAQPAPAPAPDPAPAPAPAQPAPAPPQSPAPAQQAPAPQ